MKVEINDGRLVISGERKTEAEEKKEGFYRRERSYGSFYRAIPLPDGARVEDVKATFSAGVLEVSIPLPANVTPKPQSIQIEEPAKAEKSPQPRSPGLLAEPSTRGRFRGQSRVALPVPPRNFARDLPGRELARRLPRRQCPATTTAHTDRATPQELGGAAVEMNPLVVQHQPTRLRPRPLPGGDDRHSAVPAYRLVGRDAATHRALWVTTIEVPRAEITQLDDLVVHRGRDHRIEPLSSDRRRAAAGRSKRMARARPRAGRWPPDRSRRHPAEVLAEPDEPAAPRHALSTSLRGMPISSVEPIAHVFVDGQRIE